VPPGGEGVSAVIRDVVQLAKAGVHVDRVELAEKTGYALVEEGRGGGNLRDET
jgi:hypothetical protein